MRAHGAADFTMAPKSVSKKRRKRARHQFPHARALPKIKGVPPQRPGNTSSPLYGGPSACHEMHNEKNEADDEQNVE